MSRDSPLGYPSVMTGEHRGDAEAARSAWDEASAFGIDVTLLEANLRRTPAERIRELVAMNRFQAAVQARAVPEAVRARLARAELEAKFGALLRDAL